MQAVMGKRSKSRHVGTLLIRGEIGTVKKRAPKIKVALIYPNSYWVGMSNLGLHTIYHELNRREDSGCERAFFSPSPRKPPLSLESQRPLSRFDVLAISCSFELDYPNVLQMIRQARVPLFSRERAGGYPLIMAGGCFTFFNFRPLANFVDWFVVGEAEEVIHEVMDVINIHFPVTTYRKKRKLLEELAEIEGVWVPGVSRDVRIRRIDVNRHETVSRIISPYTEFRNMYLVELARGCDRGCKFCLTGCVYGRMRTRGLSMILESCRIGLKYTRRIGLVAAAASDYPGIDELCQRLQEMDAKISTSSLRPDSLTPALLDVLNRSGQRTFTIAPEAGSQRLRYFINKRITDDQILSAISRARQRGMKRVKLYFMIGLPTETNDDILSLIELVKKVGRILPAKCSITPFIPKPKTPFGGFEMEAKSSLKAKLGEIRGKLKRYPQISIISESLSRSFLQAKLAKGDESSLDSFLI